MVEVAVMEAEGALAGRPTLASGIADAAAARLLIFDELPVEERPREEERVLLVGIVWGGTTLIELEQVGKDDDLTVSRLFDLPASTLPRNFRLVKHSAGGHVVTLPEHPPGPVELLDLPRSPRAPLVLHALVDPVRREVGAALERGLEIAEPLLRRFAVVPLHVPRPDAHHGDAYRCRSERA